MGWSAGLSLSFHGSKLTVVPVSQLVRQNSFDLRRRALLDQSVVDHDMLGPRQAVKVRIGMSASLAPVDHVEMLEREAETARESQPAREATGTSSLRTFDTYTLTLTHYIYSQAVKQSPVPRPNWCR